MDVKLAKLLDVFEKTAQKWNAPEDWGFGTSDSESFNHKEKLALETVDKKLLTEFAVDKDERIRAAVAANVNAPIEIINYLLQDKSELVKNIAKDQIFIRSLKR